MNVASEFPHDDTAWNKTDGWNGTMVVCIRNFQLYAYLAPVLRWIIPILAMAGILGNLLILIVFSSRGITSKTNFILSAMAAADLAHTVVAVVTNLYLYENVIDSNTFSRFYHHGMKPMLMTMVNWLAMTSTWLAVAVTIERFIAIRYPLKARLMFRKHQIVMAICGIAVASLLVCSYYPFWLRPISAFSCHDRRRVLYRLIPDPKLWLYGHLARQIHSILCTILPISLLFYYNCSLIYYLRKRRDSTLFHQLTEASRMQRVSSINDVREYKVAIVVLAISLTTACLLSPSACIVLYDAIRYLLSTFSGQTIPTPHWYIPINTASNALVFIQKISDFYLYCFSSRAFRRRLFSVLFSKGARKSLAVVSYQHRRSGSILHPIRADHSAVPYKPVTRENESAMELKKLKIYGQVEGSEKTGMSCDGGQSSMKLCEM